MGTFNKPSEETHTPSFDYEKYIKGASEYVALKIAEYKGKKRTQKKNEAHLESAREEKEIQALKEYELKKPEPIDGAKAETRAKSSSGPAVSRSKSAPDTQVCYSAMSCESAPGFPDGRYSPDIEESDVVPYESEKKPVVSHAMYSVHLPPRHVKDEETSFSCEEMVGRPKSADQILSNIVSDNQSSVSRAEELSKYTQPTFVDGLLNYIDSKGLKDSAVYKAAQIDRRLFSKIVSDRNYSPSKDTCILLCFALELSLPLTQEMLERAGYSFSHSKKRDIVLEYLFREQIYNLDHVNGILYRMGEKTLTKA